MTILIKGENSFIISAQARLVEDSRETASEWASKHISHNPAIKWVLGNYVEADRANRNKQFWTFDDLRMSQATVNHAPLNILHRPQHIVGTFTATEMIYPTVEGADDGAHPYIEALAAFWKAYFPDELRVVEAAHNQGSLFFSMECIASTVTCAGEGGCNGEFPYAGPQSDTYCAHLNEHVSIKQLNKPHFLAGALIFPPAAPGWGGAKITEVSNLMSKYEDQIPDIYKAIKAEADHLNESEVEQVVVEHLEQVEAVEVKKKSPKKLAEDFMKNKKAKDNKKPQAFPSNP